MARSLLSIPLLLAVHGCATAPPPGPPAKPATRLIRCNYAAGDCVHSIDVDVALAPDLPLADEIAASNGAPPARSYEVLAAGRLIEVADAGGSNVPPAVAAFRPHALEALRASMAPPRPPREWHLIALAALLRDADRPIEHADGEVLVTWLEHAADPRPVATAVFSFASRIDAKQLSRLRDRDEIALHLLGLVSEAQTGSRDALREVLRLSLEYHGELPLFHEAMRAIFPARANEGLYAALPDRPDPAARIAFIDEVARRLGEARYVAGTGWTLGKGSS